MIDATELARLDEARFAASNRVSEAGDVVRDLVVARSLGEAVDASTYEAAIAELDAAECEIREIDRARMPILAAIAANDRREREAFRREHATEGADRLRSSLSMLGAAIAYHADTLRWLRDHDQPFIGSAAFGGHDTGIFAMLRKHGLTERFGLR